MAKEKTEFQKFSDITDAMISEFKAKYKKITKVSIPIDEDVINGQEAKFIVARPSRKVVEAVSKYTNDGNMSKANEVILKNCVVGGDMKYLDEDEGDDDVYFALMREIGHMAQSKGAKVKKL